MVTKTANEFHVSQTRVSKTMIYFQPRQTGLAKRKSATHKSKFAGGDKQTLNRITAITNPLAFKFTTQ